MQENYIDIYSLTLDPMPQVVFKQDVLINNKSEITGKPIPPFRNGSYLDDETHCSGYGCRSRMFSVKRKSLGVFPC